MLSSVTRTVMAVLASGAIAITAVGCDDDDDDSPSDPTEQPDDNGSITVPATDTGGDTTVTDDGTDSEE